MFKTIKRIIAGEKINFILFTIFLFLIEHLIFGSLLSFNLHDYWALSLIILPTLIIFMKKVFGEEKLSSHFIYFTSLASGILMILSLQFPHFNSYIMSNLNVTIFISIVLLLIILVSSKNNEENPRYTPKGVSPKKVFNLFYINTPKAHEIAMLIDNKIMKALENEQISENLLKHNNLLNFKGFEQLGLEAGFTKEENSKVRVYENFDVKMTKSIMLRKIYDSIQNDKNTENFNTGDLVLFENIELTQRNADDTAMILNALQDSQIKNNSTEDVELNLNKMVNRILDDFSIDYSFSYGEQEEKNYLIQLPFNNDFNFENGYRPNDLQLGKLSLIGIYRGEIDFSKKDSTSSKFLQMISDSYNNSSSKTQQKLLKPSSEQPKSLQNPFRLGYTKLDDTLHLVDVIAIIQDLKIESGDEN